MIFEVKLKTALKIGNFTKDRFIKSDPVLGALNFEKERDMITISGGIMSDYVFHIPISNCEYIKASLTQELPEQPVKVVEESMEPASKAAGKRRR
jgi:hypothetical protein